MAQRMAIGLARLAWMEHSRWKKPWRKAGAALGCGRIKKSRRFSPWDNGPAKVKAMRETSDGKEMNEGEEVRQFTEKMNAFVRAHQRIIEEFGRSLVNANHFLQLADRSMDKEPLETVAMLEQIREIDLLGNLNSQVEEYRGIAGFLLPPNTPVDDLALQGEVAELEIKYEGLLEEAEKQMEKLEILLSTLQTWH